MAINKDIEPGPAIIGIAKGVKAISLRCCASSVTFLLTPRFLLKVPESNPKPEVQITIPPAIRNTSILIPKNFKTYSPIKKEMIKMIQTLIAAQSAVLFFDSLESSCVKPKKMGTLPNGLITENKAANVSKNKSMIYIIVCLKVAKIKHIYNSNLILYQKFLRKHFKLITL